MSSDPQEERIQELIAMRKNGAYAALFSTDIAISSVAFGRYMNRFIQVLRDEYAQGLGEESFRDLSSKDSVRAVAAVIKALNGALGREHQYILCLVYRRDEQGVFAAALRRDAISEIKAHTDPAVIPMIELISGTLEPGAQIENVTLKITSIETDHMNIDR